MQPMYVSQKDVAIWLAIGARHVRELTTKGVLTQTPHGYDLKASVHAYLAFLRSTTGGVTEERERLLKAQADMGELKVRQRTGELVLRSAVAKQTFDAVRQARGSHTEHSGPCRRHPGRRNGSAHDPHRVDDRNSPSPGGPLIMTTTEAWVWGLLALLLLLLALG